MKSMIMYFEGPNAEAVARYVGKRLTELGYLIKQEASNQLELEDISDTVDIVEAKTWQINAHDPIDFAGEKILDDLDSMKVINLEQTDIECEDEEAIRQRLQDLGYIE